VEKPSIEHKFGLKVIYCPKCLFYREYRLGDRQDLFDLKEDAMKEAISKHIWAKPSDCLEPELHVEISTVFIIKGVN